MWRRGGHRLTSPIPVAKQPKRHDAKPDPRDAQKATHQAERASTNHVNQTPDCIVKEYLRNQHNVEHSTCGSLCLSVSSITMRCTSTMKMILMYGTRWFRELQIFNFEGPGASKIPREDSQRGTRNGISGGRRKTKRETAVPQAGPPHTGQPHAGTPMAPRSTNLTAPFEAHLQGYFSSEGPLPFKPS